MSSKGHIAHTEENFILVLLRANVLLLNTMEKLRLRHFLIPRAIEGLRLMASDGLTHMLHYSFQNSFNNTHLQWHIVFPFNSDAFS